MGRRFFKEYKPDFVSFYRTWGNCPHRGKYTKKRLAKARRRAWKQCRYFEEQFTYRSLYTTESDCNWKGW